MRGFTNRRIAGDNNMTFKRHAVPQSHVSGYATKGANSNVSAQFYAVINNGGFMNISHKRLLRPVSKGGK